jgi:hypothetical protein
LQVFDQIFFFFKLEISKQKGHLWC